MPFLKDIPHDDGTHIYVWDVTENPDELETLCARRGIDTSDTKNIMSPKRQSELLVERLLLFLIFDAPIELRHTPDGKPFVTASNEVFISVTHTFGLVCIATNEHHPIGIDVERRGTRVLRVRDKFLAPDEQKFIPADDVDAHLIAWTAKEALYKVAATPGMSFRDDLRLLPFRTLAAGPLSLHGQCAGKQYSIRSMAWYGHVITLAYEIGNE